MDPNVSNVIVLVYLILFPGNTHFFILLIVVIIHICKFENPSLQFLNVKNEWHYLPASYVVLPVFKELTEPTYVN